MMYAMCVGKLFSSITRYSMNRIHYSISFSLVLMHLQCCSSHPASDGLREGLIEWAPGLVVYIHLLLFYTFLIFLIFLQTILISYNTIVKLEQSLFGYITYAFYNFILGLLHIPLAILGFIHARGMFIINLRVLPIHAHC